MAKRRYGKKHSGGMKIALLIVLALVLVLAGAEGVLLYRHKHDGRFLKGTYFLGEDVSGQTPEDLVKKVTASAQSVRITLNESGSEALNGSLSDFGYTLDADSMKQALEKAMEQQKASWFDIAVALLGRKVTTLDAGTTWKFDEQTLKNKVTAANFPAERVASKDAALVSDEKTLSMVIQPETVGNTFDDAKLQSWMKEQIDGSLNKNGLKNITLDFPKELYILPSVSSTDEALVSEMNALNTYAGAEITYDFGSETEVLDHKTIMSWVTVKDGKAVLDEDAIADFVTSLAGKYNTRYHVRKFTTTGGEEITIPEEKNEYGYRINADDEAAQIKKDITSGSAVEREPVYYKTNSYDNPLYLKREGTDDLAGTYVEVSIRKQHVWFYQDGELVVESDCVTGDVTKDHGTETGAFPLAFKKQDYTLTGGNGNGAYATPVKWWMPFFEGQGLHDASWRSKFGGLIYKGNGSHGCVNLPASVAEKIYNNIEPGTCIIIYDD